MYPTRNSSTNNIVPNLQFRDHSENHCKMQNLKLVN